MKTLILSAIATAAASSAMANTPAICALNPAAAGCPITAVPEISALEGTAAIAALAAIVLLTWERRRRAV